MHIDSTQISLRFVMCYAFYFCILEEERSYTIYQLTLYARRNGEALMFLATV